MSTHTQQEANRDQPLQETFDWLADRYLTQTRLVSRGRYRHWMDHVTRLIQAWQPRSLVDIGCGPGYLLDQLGSILPNCQLTGVDYSSRMLHNVPQNIKTQHQSAHAWAESTTQQFDVVVMTFFLRDQSRPLATIQQLSPRLHPRGHLLILETHSPQGLRGLGFNLYFHHIVPWWGATRLTRDWPSSQGSAPYRVLSASHRRWTRSEPLPQALSQSGYRDITRHTSAADVVELWTAQRT